MFSRKDRMWFRQFAQDCFHEASTSSTDDSDVLHPETGENNTEQGKGASPVSLQRLSPISQRPPAHAVQLSIKIRHYPARHVVGQSISQAVWPFLVFSMAFPYLLPLRKVWCQIISSKPARWWHMEAHSHPGFAGTGTAHNPTFRLAPWESCSFPVTTHLTFNKLVINCAHEHPPEHAEWVSVEGIWKLCDHNSKYNEWGEDKGMTHLLRGYILRNASLGGFVLRAS